MTILEQMDLPMSLAHLETQSTHKVTFTLLFQVIGLSEQYGWQIKQPEYYYLPNWHPSQSTIAK